ncbi:394_t:CDS:2, partial [Gigaspora rosea]
QEHPIQECSTEERLTHTLLKKNRHAQNAVDEFDMDNAKVFSSTRDCYFQVWGFQI